MLTQTRPRPSRRFRMRLYTCCAAIAKKEESRSAHHHASARAFVVLQRVRRRQDSVVNLWKQGVRVMCKETIAAHLRQTRHSADLARSLSCQRGALEQEAEQLVLLLRLCRANLQAAMYSDGVLTSTRLTANVRMQCESCWNATSSVTSCCTMNLLGLSAKAFRCRN